MNSFSEKTSHDNNYDDVVVVDEEKPPHHNTTNNTTTTIVEGATTVPSSQWNLSKETIGELQVLACGIFFGLTFVGERKAMIDGMNAYTFNFARYFISIFALIILQPLFYLLFESKSDNVKILEEERLRRYDGNEQVVKWVYRRDVVLWGGLISLVCFGGATLQQIGMKELSASKTGFITRLSVIVVPLMEWMIPGLGGRMTKSLLIAITISVTGLYLLSGCTESACFEGHLEPGEIWVILSMTCWSLCSVFSVLGCRYVDSLTITYVHFIVVTVLCLFVAIAADPSAFKYPFKEFTDNWLMILAVGVFECVGFVLSGLAFMYVDGSKVSLLMTSITVFTAIFGFIFLGETLSPVESVGAVLVVIAVLVIYHEALTKLLLSCLKLIQGKVDSSNGSSKGFEMLPISSDATSDSTIVSSHSSITFSPLSDSSSHPLTTNVTICDSLDLEEEAVTSEGEP